MNDLEFIVMDSRAQVDVDSAAILEACGPKQPTWRSLRKDWGSQGAVLVRWHSPIDGVYTAHEIMGVIR